MRKKWQTPAASILLLGHCKKCFSADGVWVTWAQRRAFFCTAERVCDCSLDFYAVV